MKHIKQDFSLKAWAQPPGVDLGGGAKAKIELFRNMVMLHIKLKPAAHATTWYIFYTQTNPRLGRWGQNVKSFFFSESSQIAYQIKGN